MSGRCQSSFELPEACSLPLTEPSDLFERDLIGDTAPVIVGGLFRLKGDSDPNRAAAARLVVRDINNAGSGLIGQRPLALVSCDVSGPGDEVLAGEERAEHLRGLVDFFSKTLGTPLIVGPMTSSDSLNAIDHVITKKYPTVIISPSATSPALTTVDEKLADDQPGLFWRTAPSDELQAQVMAESVVGEFPTESPCGTKIDPSSNPHKGIGKVAVLYVDDAYGLGLASAFSGKHSPTELFPFTTGVNLDAVANQALQVSPDAFLIVAVDTSDTVALLDVIDDYVMGAPERAVYLTDGSKSDTLLKTTTDPAAPLYKVIFERTVGTSPATTSTADSPIFKGFAAQLLKEFSVDAQETSFVAQTYDAAYVGSYGLLYGLAQKGAAFTGIDVARGMQRLSDPNAPSTTAVGSLTWAEMKKKMAESEPSVNIAGVTGDLDFDELGETTSPIEIWQPCASCGTAGCNLTVETLD